MIIAKLLKINTSAMMEGLFGPYRYIAGGADFLSPT
jgi:hypothetical protein